MGTICIAVFMVFGAYLSQRIASSYLRSVFKCQFNFCSRMNYVPDRGVRDSANNSIMFGCSSKFNFRWLLLHGPSSLAGGHCMYFFSLPQENPQVLAFFVEETTTDPSVLKYF